VVGQPRRFGFLNGHRKHRSNATSATNCDYGDRVDALEPLAGETVKQEADGDLAQVDDDYEGDFRCEQNL
jgi:hypothetical protein